MARSKKIEVEEGNNSVIDINIDQLIPNVIDDYIVTIFENHHTLFLPPNITGTHFKAWHTGKGGIFSKDVLNYSLGKNHGKYIIIKSSGEDQVVRIIEEEEEIHFKALKLLDGHIKDKPYMILKTLQEGEDLSSTKIKITENEIDLEENMFIPASDETSHDDDVDQHQGSISLFRE